jgi:hypothetical protein
MYMPGQYLIWGYVHFLLHSSKFIIYHHSIIWCHTIFIINSIIKQITNHNPEYNNIQKSFGILSKSHLWCLKFQQFHYIHYCWTLNHSLMRMMAQFLGMPCCLYCIGSVCVQGWMTIIKTPYSIWFAEVLSLQYLSNDAIRNYQ